MELHFQMLKGMHHRLNQAITLCYIYEYICLCGTLCSKKGKEHVECNLDSIDVWNTPLVRDEPEVDKVDLKEREKGRNMFRYDLLKQ